MTKPRLIDAIREKEMGEGEKPSDSEVCGLCKKAFKAGDVVSQISGGGKVHGACVKCSQCGRPLQQYTQSPSGELFCQACFRKQVPKCGVCGKSIGMSAVQGDDGSIFHPACFAQSGPKCMRCGKAIGEEEYVDVPDGGEDAAIHASCFTCKRCKKDLSGEAFHGTVIDPLCDPCWHVVEAEDEAKFLAERGEEDKEAFSKELHGRIKEDWKDEADPIIRRGRREAMLAKLLEDETAAPHPSVLSPGK